MAASRRPHVLGIDDGPFEKHQRTPVRAIGPLAPGQHDPVPVVGVMMEGASVLESVAIASLEVDTGDATGFLIGWIEGLRCLPTVQAVILGGITLAGLGVVDVAALAQRLARPVLVVNRRDPRRSRLTEALLAAGYAERIPLVEQTPEAVRIDDGLHLAWSGIDRSGAEALLEASLGKARLPEALRVAHIVARALVTGESRGRA